MLDTHEAFHQFIEFGYLFDRPSRKYMVEYLYAKLTHQPLPDAPASSGQYFAYFRQALDRILGSEPLLLATADSPLLAREVAADLLKWVRKVDKKLQEDNPHYEESKTLGAWAHRPTFLWKESWYQLLNYLQLRYAAAELDTAFYADQFKQLMPKAPNNPQEQQLADQQPQKAKVDLVIDDLLAQWDALLAAKILQWQAEEIEQAGEQLASLLEAKSKEYLQMRELIDPFATEAGRYWDLSRGLWQEASFEILDKYRILLENEDGIRKLVELLGQMREAQIELEEEVFEEVIVRKEWVNDPFLREEVTGVHGSNDLSRILPSEAAFLAEDATSALFYQKFADSSLQSFHYTGKKLVTSNRVNTYTQQRQKKKEKGPFILCIDTSGSMHGLPAQIAKVLAFGILKMASKENRKCYLINFSIGIKTINLHDLANNMDKIVEFLMLSFDGGTDVTPALSEALEQLQTHDYRDADVLMVSDFVMFKIREDVVQRIRREQHKGTRFHSLTLSKSPNIQVLQAFDHYWVYDPEEKQVIKKIWEEIQELANHDA